MAKLTGQTIADSYDQLLIVDGANGITSSLQAVESADTGGSSSALSISTVAISVAGNATITTADNSDTLTLISTDADADSGPNLRMYRNSGSPAQNDIAGQIEFQGRNNNSQDVAYGQIYSKIETVTDGSEDGDMKFSTMKGGTLRDRLNIHTTATVFNEDHEDVDFRVESDTITHALFVQGSDGNVGIGTTAPGSALEVVTVDATDDDVSTVLTVSHGTTGTADDNIGGEIVFKNEVSSGSLEPTASIQAIMANADEGTSTYDGHLQFRTINNKSYIDAMRIDHGGQVGIGTTSPGAKLHIESTGDQLQIKSSASDGGAAAIEFVADAGGDDADFVQIFVANQGVMQFNDKSTGSYVTNMSITASTGTVNVVGELTAGTKTFTIDHPVDPDNKILYHMAVESPRVDLIYRGMAKLVNGKATVDLNKDSGTGMMDGTFEALTQNAVVVSLQNQDSFDNVKPGSISGSLFEITCNNPACSDEVAWVVMAERADRFIKTLSKTDAQGRLIPEEDKELPDLSLLEDKEEDTDNIEDDGQERFIPVDMEGKKGYKIHSKAYGDMPTRKVTKKYREKQ